MLLKKKENSILLFISITLAINTLFYVDQRATKILLLPFRINVDIFNFIAFLLLTLTIGSAAYFYKKELLPPILGKLLLAYLPAELLIIYGLQNEAELNAFFGFASALYILLAAIYLTYIHHTGTQSAGTGKIAQETGRTRIKWMAPATLLVIISLNLFIGGAKIGQFAAVDEPLWTFDRIPNFWRDVNEYDWIGSRVSDKPGFTVALISGIGLFFEENPKQFKDMPWRGNLFISEQEIEKFNFTFRFPLYLFASLSILAFYFLIKKLTGEKTALLSAAFIGLSPILIGNARIINPDGLLWIFTTLAIISYLIYLIHERKKYLYLAGFILGLSILTKYVANILYIFFFALIFLEYIFNFKKRSLENLREYLKKHLLDYFLLVAISFATYYVLYPGVWGKPSRVLLGTIQSQAFAGIWPLFAAIIVLILADMAFLKNFLLEKIISPLSKYRRLIFSSLIFIFLASVIFTLANTYADMRFINFEEGLSSPKSSFERVGPLGLFLSNFYPLVFGVSPIITIFILMFSFKNIFRSNLENHINRIIIYLFIFILLYYAGATVSQVASIIRYQVMLYPIFLIAGTLSIFTIIKQYEEKFAYSIVFASLLAIVLITNTFALISIKPFFEDYASLLLPKKYYINFKDMGSGSYEAAQYLNSLPDPEGLRVWTDKQGVCSFFKGICSGTFSSQSLNTIDFNYFVVSSGRENRTIRINASKTIRGKTFDNIYHNEKDVAYRLELGGRPNNYVKIIDAKKLFD